MFKLIYKFLILVFLITTTRIEASSILITYFEPYSSFKKNSSETIAKEILKKYSKDHRIKLCKLPVVFDSSRDDLEDLNSLKIPKSGTSYSAYKACKQSTEFDFTISIGMHPHNKFKFEFLARNLMGSDNSNNISAPIYAIDSAGNELKKLYLIENTDEYSQSVGSNILNSYCKLYSNKKHRDLKSFSFNLGSYVCNNLSYKILSQESNTNFLFVHVPQKLPDDDRYSSQIMSVVNDALLYESIEVKDRSRFKFCLDVAKQRIRDNKSRFRLQTIDSLEEGAQHRIY